MLDYGGEPLEPGPSRSASSRTVCCPRPAGSPPPSTGGQRGSQLVRGVAGDCRSPRHRSTAGAALDSSATRRPRVPDARVAHSSALSLGSGRRCIPPAVPAAPSPQQRHPVAAPARPPAGHPGPHPALVAAVRAHSSTATHSDADHGDHAPARSTPDSCPHGDTSVVFTRVEANPTSHRGDEAGFAASGPASSKPEHSVQTSSCTPTRRVPHLAHHCSRVTTLPFRAEHPPGGRTPWRSSTLLAHRSGAVRLDGRSTPAALGDSMAAAAQQGATRASSSPPKACHVVVGPASSATV